MIRHVRADEAARVKALRLRALAANPEAFGATHDGDAAKPDEWWRMIATLSDAGVEQRAFVAVDDDADAWLGFIVVRPDDFAPGDATINATWVAPEARGRGLGRALAEACVAWAAERGFPAVNVALVVGNEAAQRTYEAAGFVAGDAKPWSEGGRTLELLVLRRTL